MAPADSWYHSQAALSEQERYRKAKYRAKCCGYCGRYGHTEEECFDKLSKTGPCPTFPTSAATATATDSQLLGLLGFAKRPRSESGPCAQVLKPGFTLAKRATVNAPRDASASSSCLMLPMYGVRPSAHQPARPPARLPRSLSDPPSLPCSLAVARVSSNRMLHGSFELHICSALSNSHVYTCQ